MSLKEIQLWFYFQYSTYDICRGTLKKGDKKTVAVRGLEELFFQLCCCVSFWFWWEIGFGFRYLRT
jgi:hypothetical protein